MMCLIPMTVTRSAKKESLRVKEAGAINKSTEAQVQTTERQWQNGAIYWMRLEHSTLERFVPVLFQFCSRPRCLVL